MAIDHVRRIGGLSRIVDRDIEILKMNLVQLHDGRYEARSSSWNALKARGRRFAPSWPTTALQARRPETSPQAMAPRVTVAEIEAPMAVVPAVPLALRPRSLDDGLY